MCVCTALIVLFFMALPCFVLQAADGSDILQYGQDAAGGLMESSYRNLQEARVTLQAAYALMTAGAGVSLLCCAPFAVTHAAPNGQCM